MYIGNKIKKKTDVNIFKKIKNKPSGDSNLSVQRVMKHEVIMDIGFKTMLFIVITNEKS